MATMVVDGVEFRVIGRPGWSSVQRTRVPLRGGRPGDYVEQTVACFIEAVVELPRERRVAELDKAAAKVSLYLDDGGLVEGDGMWAVGNLAVVDERLRVRYEGPELWERDPLGLIFSGTGGLTAAQHLLCPPGGRARATLFLQRRPVMAAAKL